MIFFLAKYFSKTIFLVLEFIGSFCFINIFWQGTTLTNAHIFSRNKLSKWKKVSKIYYNFVVKRILNWGSKIIVFLISQHLDTYKWIIICLNVAQQVWKRHYIVRRKWQWECILRLQFTSQIIFIIFKNRKSTFKNFRFSCSFRNLNGKLWPFIIL